MAPRYSTWAPRRKQNNDVVGRRALLALKDRTEGGSNRHSLQSDRGLIARCDQATKTHGTVDGLLTRIHH